uniref:Glucosylceramidase n=1 Tax=Rhipicephalus appendiculatus TaxID=34631 RepID=A0A131Z3G7_RHIAP
MGNDLLTTLSTLAVVISVAAPTCWPRNYGFGSNVCVCSTAYCDFIGNIGPLPRGAALAFESSKSGLRFERTVLFRKETDPPDANIVLLVVNPGIRYQEIFGFGGAFTDSVGLNLRQLPTQLQDAIIASYYSPAGIEYSIARIPMASTDFSVRKYTYDDYPDDFSLLNFTLAAEDFYLKIPYMKRAMYMSNRPILFYGSPWSSPAWMKTSNKLEGRGYLRGKPGGPFYKTWAAYFVRFVQAYERLGIPIWGLTVQNEPTAGRVPFYPWQALGFTPTTQRDFIKLDLGPALNMAGYGKLKLMMLDDNRFGIRGWTSVVLSDPEAAKYVHGIAVHWYMDRMVGPRVLDKVHESYPDKFILPSEACTGYTLKGRGVKLGSWERAEEYASDILQDLNHWARGWTDWNLALDTQGGPNWARNFVDSPIIVNATAQEFYKQPMYYALGHFSKFLPRGSVRIDSRLKQGSAKIEYAAFLTPEMAVVVIVLNKSHEKIKLRIIDVYGSASVQNVIEGRSITTFTWRL